MASHTGAASPTYIQASVPTTEAWKAERDRVSRWTLRRAWLYNIFLETSLWIAVFALFLWKCPPAIPDWPELACRQFGSWPYYLYGAAEYVLPRAFEGLAAFLIFEWPWYLSLAVVVLVPTLLLVLKVWFRKGELSAREDARKRIHEVLR